MLKFALCFLFGVFALADERSQLRYRICTYSEEDYTKCMHTVHVAKVDLKPLPLDCFQLDDRQSCIDSIRDGYGDMTVLTGHGYKAARNEGLRPVVFAREDDNNLSIAVAPRNISLVELQEAPIYMKNTNHRSFHAALFFNLQRGHELCGPTKVQLGPYISIEDSASYQPNDDEILICADRTPSEFSNYKHCNVETGLQRAVFAKPTVSEQQIATIHQIFESILQRYGPNSPSSRHVNRHGYNFFATFLDSDDLIFKNNTIAFDLEPTYRNGVDEDVFNHLHCNKDQQPHDPNSLL